MKWAYLLMMDGMGFNGCGLRQREEGGRDGMGWYRVDSSGARHEEGILVCLILPSSILSLLVQGSDAQYVRGQGKRHVGVVREQTSAAHAMSPHDDNRASLSPTFEDVEIDNDLAPWPRVCPPGRHRIYCACCYSPRASLFLLLTR